MTKSIASVNTAADKFSVWIGITNQLANAMTTEVVTANTNANGSVTTGNGFVNGIFGSNTLVVFNALRGGNVQVSNTLVITSNVNIGSNILLVGNSTVNATVNSLALKFSNSTVSMTFTLPTLPQVSDGSFYLNANGSYISLGTVTSTTDTSGTSAQLIDSFAMSSYRTADYTISVKNNVANGYQATQMLVLQDAGDAHYTEYATLVSNVSLGTMSANSNTTHVRLYFTPSVSNTTVRLNRNTLGV
jgi:hypothetical protein